jgi:hypothetical protein
VKGSEVEGVDEIFETFLEWTRFGRNIEEEQS